ncbi:MAG: uroporphyrinogen decarboxylase family protein [Bryobacterales bacterium]|nr:uroporphyrinogen decarboxylase family protein [Bryobacterales bacterium]
MAREFFLALAARGARFPIAADLVLAEEPDGEAVRMDGERLGRVIERTARRFSTPLAIPLMDLRLEKADLLALLGVPEAARDGFRFAEPPPADAIHRVEDAMEAPFAPRHRAHIESVRYVARHTDLFPTGMVIGPFSLATKLLGDPITAVALAGRGLTGEDDPGVLTLERCLALAECAVVRSLTAQIRAGARAMLICEPAASTVYLSPRQIASGSPIFERFIIEPHLRLKQRLDRAGADLILHDCGELTPAMIEQFARRLHPAMLSLGSTVKLWEAAKVVPKDVVLYGNLPTKSFYSDAAMPVERVVELARELCRKMREAGHPHILGSECDVLDVPEARQTIWRKIRAMLEEAA